MLNKTSVLRVLAAVIRDAGSAYSCFGFLPYMPSEFWSPIDVAPEADQTDQLDQVEPARSVRWHASSETSTGRGPRVRRAV